MKRDVTVERLKVLSNAETWLQNTLTTSAEEYRVKVRMLQISFHTVFGSPLLDPPQKRGGVSPPGRLNRPPSPQRIQLS